MDSPRSGALRRPPSALRLPRPRALRFAYRFLSRSVFQPLTPTCYPSGPHFLRRPLMAVTSSGLLPTTVLEAFRSRAAGYDRDNKFFQEDFEDLRKHGYLKMAVPRELGGLGFTLADVARETRRVAQYAPPTA